MAYLTHNQMKFCLMSCGMLVEQCVFTSFIEKTNDIIYVVRWNINSLFFIENTIFLGLFLLKISNKKMFNRKGKNTQP